MEKIRIKKEIKLFNEEMLEGGLESVISGLKQLSIKLESDGWTNIVIEKRYYCESSEFMLFGENLEDDIEYQARLERESKKAQNKAIKEALELKQYEMLKLKYGNK